MNTLDDLRSSLDSYADRGHARGADAVWAAAEPDATAERVGSTTTGRTGSRRTLLVLTAAVVCVVVAASIALVRSGRDAEVVTSPTPGETVATPAPTDAPRALRPIVVPSGSVRAVFVAFDRIWVATIEPDVGIETARLRSFDIDSGEQTSEAPVVGAGFQLAATDRFVWLRTTTGGPASFPIGTGGEGDQAIYRIDPTSGEATPVRYLNGDGPLATTGDRIAAADVSHVEIVDEQGDELASATVDETVGVDGATFPGTNGIVALAFGPSGSTGDPPPLYAVHSGRNELLELDPTTGRHLATQVVEDGAERLGPWLAPSGAFVWAAGRTTAYGTLTPLAVAALSSDRRISAGDQVHDLAPLSDGRVLVMTRSQALVVGDGATVNGQDAQADQATTLDPAADGSIVFLDGQPWIAQHPLDDTGRSTIVSFVRVRTDDSMPAGSPPATAPPPAVHVLATEPLVDGQSVPVAATGLPAGAAVTLSVCLRGDPGPCAQTELVPRQVEHVGPGAGVGELVTAWIAERRFTDDRTHDCAIEACVLRVYGVDDAGRRDASTVLAETPLTFSAG